MSEDQEYDLIDRYLQKEMGKEEAEAFKIKLLTNSDFAEKFEARKFAHDLILEGEMLRLKNKIKADLNNQKDSFDWKKITIPTIGGIFIASSAYFSYNYLNKSEEESTPSEIKREFSINNSSNKNDSLQEYSSEKTKTSLLNADNPSFSIANNSKKPAFYVNVPNVNDSIPVYFERPLNSPEVFNENNKEEKTLDDQCNTVKISALTSTTPSCENEATGSVSIDIPSVKGGLAPYSYSVDGKNYYTLGIFNKLSNGNHSIYFKDQNNCISLQQVIVPSKQCHEMINEAFNPVYGETWKFPMNNHLNGTIKIFNKQKATVYSETISNGQPTEWNGKDNKGIELPEGLYYFILHLENDDVNGYVTIVK